MLGGATLCDKYIEYGINGWVQNKMMLKFAKNMIIGTDILKT